MVKKILTSVTLLIFFAGTTLIAQNFEYIGAMKCKMCHNKSAKGSQYDTWAKGPHANAMKSLSNEKSMAYAKKNGIADPTKEPSCIKCHSTVGGTDKNLHAGIKISEGVSCESCHGPGSVYKSMSIMKSREKSLENGLIVPDEKLCVSCHNKENPFYKPFNYEEALKKIAHDDPTTK